MIIPTKFNGYGPDGRRLYFKGKGGSSGSKQMEQMEAQRQARISAAVNTINNIFDPRPYQKGVEAATSFDPTKMYYNADGTRFSAATTSKGALKGGGKGNSRYQNVNGQLWDMQAVNDALAKGQLYSGVETITPDSREKLYQEQKQAIFDINAKELDDQFQNAERANRFGLARNGLMGGSADIESNAKLQDKVSEGLIQAQAKGEEAASQLRTNDEQSKASLIAMAQSGIDTGTAQQMAASQLAANAQTALGNRGGATIDRLFDSLSQAYLTNKLYQAAQNGMNFYNRGVGNYSTRGGDSGTIHY